MRRAPALGTLVRIARRSAPIRSLGGRRHAAFHAAGAGGGEAGGRRGPPRGVGGAGRAGGAPGRQDPEAARPQPGSAASPLGIPEIQFDDLPLGEDLLGAEGPLGAGGGAGGGEAPEPRPEPIPDEEIAGVDPRRLRRDQLVWVAGRAASLGLASPGLWRGVAEAVEALGESQLTPSEVCRLVQAFAYAPRSAPLESAQLQRLMKAFAQRSEEYSDERLARVVYGYGKLAAKRGLRLQKFLDFAASEVLERSGKLRGWPSLRILRSVWHLDGAGGDFRAALVGQVARKLESLDLESLAAFAPMLVEAGHHERPGVPSKLNSVFKRRLYTYREPSLLLRTGLALLLQDLLRASTAALWLLRLSELGVAPGAGGAPGGARAAAAAGDLEALKLAELCLRHERPAVLAGLPPGALRLLAAARGAPLAPPEGRRLLELPFVFAELGRLCAAAGLLLHPVLCGPYLLELADPFGRAVLEWDANWALYPPWRRARHRDFVRRKHLHLAAEGWRVLRVPLSEFRALGSAEEKVGFLGAFAERHGLGHLRLPA